MGGPNRMLWLVMSSLVIGVSHIPTGLAAMETVAVRDEDQKFLDALVDLQIASMLTLYSLLQLCCFKKMSWLI
jgi:hypothetical protein